MASIITRANGTREIAIVMPGKKRQVLRMGRLPLKRVESIKARVEDLVTAKLSGQPLAPATADWLKDASNDVLRRLEKLGLATARVEAPTLGVWLAAYLDGSDQLRVKPHAMKPRTRIDFNQVRGWLLDYFGAEKPLDCVTAADAEQWRKWLATQGKMLVKQADGTKRLKTLGKNTIRKHCQRAGQIFAAAVKRKLIAENPFADMRDLTMHVGEDRDQFVSVEVADQVLKACPNAQWALLFALSRYGGLRIPSEARELRWCDVDWERQRMLVHAPKTEHVEGKATRWVPIFAELRPWLQAAHQEALEAADSVPGKQGQPLGWVITLDCIRNARYGNPGTHMKRIIERRAGLDVWPKLWHNCRASRETELCDSFPEHVALAWIGNSKKVARRHYLRPTDQHFAQAAGSDSSSTIDANRRDQAQQKAQQSDAATGGPETTTVQLPDRQPLKNIGKTRGASSPVHSGQSNSYPGRDSNPRPPV